MPRLTQEAKDCINTLKDVMSNRQLRDYLEEHNYGKYSQAAVGRQKKKMIESLKYVETSERVSDTLDTSETIQTLEKKDPTPAKPRKKRTPQVLNFNDFMLKLDTSNSFTAKHLKQLITVKGRHSRGNKERVIRIIRDVLDLIEE